MNIRKCPRLHSVVHHTSSLANVLLSGGEEVLLDVGGQDATEAFEDVGHSDEAREILSGLQIGTIKRQVRSFFYQEIRNVQCIERTKYVKMCQTLT